MDVAEVNQQCSFKKADREGLENVDRTHLALASDKPSTTEKEMEQMKTRAGNLSTEIKSKADVELI